MRFKIDETMEYHTNSVAYYRRISNIFYPNLLMDFSACFREQKHLVTRCTKAGRKMQFDY